MLDIPENMRTKLRRQRMLQIQNVSHIREALSKAGMRPTRQRMAIGNLLLCGDHQHVSADELHLKLGQTGYTMSLATVYNTLNQFASAGLIRKISVSGQRTFFDTNAHNHQHFYLEDEDRMIDISGDILQLQPMPLAPSGYHITKIDVLISLKKNTPVKTRTSAKETAEQKECRGCGDCTKACHTL